MKLKKSLSILLLGVLVVACSTNPFTGKQTLALVPNSQILPMAFQQYNEFLSENKVVTGTAEANMVKNVGQKIASAAERYLTANGYAGYLTEYRWEYNLVNSPEVNAWCMPGGKIVVYTGILPITKDEAGLAAVMGHEVAHALANHGQQRMSAGQLQQLGAVAGNIALSGDAQNQQIFNTAYGLGSNLGVMLPFSRSHEIEADHIGLILMAIAGYDPIVSAELWQRMQAQESGNKPPEFLSTHPSSATRIQNIRTWAPEARAEARKFGVTTFKK
ncbi:M48 family metallopeptidase [Aequorivita lipolytica]|uniref:M48 family metallopeptidase n=1 Tax=Aequorivita lipolytica TaxID=153267 RepID=A0A5C6YM12_9FLAO|nr:M48 family metallopeptidase [Aequorivita lipolytica]TXD68382.1 M48 family metallopeptidase [Aequorivita lipolytica]SRX51475.1 Beta-barrel assembly-enhancing protease [Aequorivita lipolytica]